MDCEQKQGNKNFGQKRHPVKILKKGTKLKKGDKKGTADI